MTKKFEKYETSHGAICGKVIRIAFSSDGVPQVHLKLGTNEPESFACGRKDNAEVRLTQVGDYITIEYEQVSHNPSKKITSFRNETLNLVS